MSKKFKCPSCGSTDVRFFVPVHVAYKEVKGVLTYVETSPISSENFYWDKIEAECQSCEKDLPTQIIESLTADDFVE